MKKSTRIWGIALLGGILLSLFGCVSPIGGDPDGIKIKIDTTVTQGDDDWRITITDSAVLMLINRSKTIDVTKVTVRQPENPDAADPVVEFTNKPLRLTKKAQYLQPSDISYEITIEYKDFKTNPSGTPGSATVTMPLPKPLEYPLYLYRSHGGGGGIIVTPNPVEPADPDDTEDPPGQPPQSPDDGEGSVPGVVPSYNRGTMGVFVVMNMTRNQPVSKVEFEKYNGTARKYYSIITTTQTVFGSSTPVPAVKASDQRSIALGQGSWNTKLSYTVTLPGGATEGRTTDVRQSVVIPINDPQSLRSNYLYFYKRASGGFDVSHVWPPVDGDYDKDGNVDIEDTLPDGWGILELYNESETGTVLEKIRIGGDEHNIMMARGDEPLRFMLVAGDYNIAFKPYQQSDFGFNLPRTIRAGRVTKLVYVDYLGKTDVLPPDGGHGVGMIRITNMSSGLVSVVTLRNLVDSRTRTIGYEDFTPPHTIQYNQVGKILVQGTSSFPVIAGPNFLVQVEVQTPSGTVLIERRVELRNRIVDILIGPEDLIDTRVFGSRVVVVNNADTPNSVAGLMIYNVADPISQRNFNINVPNPPRGNSRSLLVLHSVNMEIRDGYEFAARVTVFVGGNYYQIDKDFDEDGYLYSDTPETHVRHITITQGDIDSVVPFIPVTNITGIPSELLSITTSSGGSTTLTGPGTLNLNSLANVLPANATKRSPIEWERLDSNSAASFNSGTGVLTVTGIADGSTVQIRARIRDAAGNAAVKTDYTKVFTITLRYSDTNVDNPVVSGSGIGLTSGTVQVGNTLDLLTLFTGFTPANPHYGGRPIVSTDLVWSIVSGGAYGSLSGRNLTGTAAGTVSVRATLPASVNGTAVSNTTTVTVTPPPLPSSVLVRVLLLNKSDGIRHLALAPSGLGPNPSLMYQDDECYEGSNGVTAGMPHLAPGAKIGSTGHTTIRWAFSTDDHRLGLGAWDGGRSEGNFKIGIYTNAVLYPVNIGGSDTVKHRDVAVPVPVDGSGYWLWLVEYDNHFVRATTHPLDGSSPKPEFEKLFYFDPVFLAENHAIWLDSNNVQRAPNTPGAQLVIPVGYHTHDNTTSIMKPRGIGLKPLHDASSKYLGPTDTWPQTNH
jgi:hypothetical protein